jgi:hypothetical protein
MVSGAILLE